MRNNLFIFILFFFTYLLPAQKINPDIYGFATSNTFTYCDVSDTSFLNKVIAINPQVLRFPGGAVGNFYHFGKSGYGFDFNEIDKYHNGKFPKRSRGLESSRKKKQHHQDYIDDFITLARKTQAKAVLVANPFVEDDNDIIFMIQKLYKNNIEIIGVELGSELSNRSYFLKGYTIEDYIFFAQRCSKNIKKQFPEIKTAVVAAPLGKRKDHRHNIWNSRLSAMNFYDAIIIHSYAKVIQGKAIDGQMVSEDIEGKNKTEEFEIYKNRVIDYLDTEYDREVQEYVSIYNKPIWVTEWNLQMSKTTGNTLLQSLFVTQYLLEVYSNPSLSSIELTTYHNLGGRDFSGSIFRNNKEVLEIQSTYYPLTLLGKIFDYDIVKVEKEQSEEIFTYNCFDANNKLIISYVIDWNKNYFRYSLEESLDKEIVHIYGSENLFDMPNLKGETSLEKD
tara:strand:+ start:2183 stop:3523 length:1341 start_codon:yes stop_codon:yes gene_type:complete